MLENLPFSCNTASIPLRPCSLRMVPLAGDGDKPRNYGSRHDIMYNSFRVPKGEFSMPVMTLRQPDRQPFAFSIRRNYRHANIGRERLIGLFKPLMEQQSITFETMACDQTIYGSS